MKRLVLTLHQLEKATKQKITRIVKAFEMRLHEDLLHKKAAYRPTPKLKSKMLTLRMI